MSHGRLMLDSTIQKLKESGVHCMTTFATDHKMLVQSPTVHQGEDNISLTTTILNGTTIISKFLQLETSEETMEPGY